MTPVDVLVPVRAFADAKRRLSGRLDADGRQRLAEVLARRTIEALAGHRVHIVCEDDGIETWAADLGARVRRVVGGDLNSAISEALRGVAGRVAIVHADLADPSALSDVLALTGNVLVPDHRGDGTNVMVLEPACRPAPAYGSGSFTRHLERLGEESRATGTVLRVVHHPRLGLDIDTGRDLDHPIVASLLAREGICAIG
ncbi:MAG: 2-phospho-L-lactate guanylyltransferase [Ilumatobacteraceae bacterium]